MVCRVASARDRGVCRLATTWVVLLFAIVTSTAQTTRTWDGGGADNNWSTPGNWSSNNVPDTPSEAALFTDDPVGQTKLTPNLSVNTTNWQLRFSATAPAYTITGTGAAILYLSPSTNFAGGGIIVSNGAANQTIAAAEVFFLTNQTWDIGGPATLTVTGTIEDDSVIDYGLTKNGTGAVVFRGDVRYDGPTVVNAGKLVLRWSNTSMLSALTVNGGILRAETNANSLGNNASRNSITLAGGALELANDTGQTFGSPSRITTVSSNSSVRADRLTAGAGVTHALGTLRIGAQTLSVAAGGNVTNGTAGITFGATTLSGNATFDVSKAGATNVQLTLGAIGQSSGTRSITKTGDGTLRLNGAGSYTGGTILSQGAITLGVANSLSSGGFTFAGGALNGNNTTDSTIGALALTTNSTLNLAPGGAAATLTFAGVSGAATGILTISGWSGSAGGLGTDDKIVFSGGAAPDADFLHHIHFDLGAGKIYFGALGAGGELYPREALVTVPDVVGLAQSLAETNLVTAGLALRTITNQPHGTVPAGAVISQSPAAGTDVTNGTPVDLIISAGATIPVLAQAAYHTGAFHVSVATMSGKLYVLESADQIPTTNWTGALAVPGDDAVHVLVDSTATNSQRFYRVRME